jgi:gluconolactonase
MHAHCPPRRFGFGFLFLSTVITCLDMQDPANAQTPSVRAMGSIERIDPALDALIPRDAKMEVIGEGMKWSEGPIWIRDGGFLLFSDVLDNTIYRWDAAGGCRKYLTPSGYTSTVPRGGETGSNGLTLDRNGKLLLCQHGDRRVARLESGWDERPPRYTTIVDKFEGKKFNSPNDIVVHSSGALYFTDPPYGLERQMDDPLKELDFQGVYRVSPTGQVALLTKEIERPNGIALSPDEKTLYVASSHTPRPVLMAYPVKEDGLIGVGKILLDARNLKTDRTGGFDGLKVDQKGNLYVTGPGCVAILTPEGKLLGMLLTTQRTANCAWGEDGSTMFITADHTLLRIKLSAKGLGW